MPVNPIQSAFEWFLAFFFNLPVSYQNFLSLSFFLWFFYCFFHIIYKMRG